MKKAILLHGLPSKEDYYSPEPPTPSNRHWRPWLTKQLIINDIHAWAPEVPRPYELNYAEWVREFERYDIDEQTILVGHSCGGGFLVRWLTEHPSVRVDKLVLIAPWVNPHREFDTDFFNFSYRRDLSKQTNGVTIFISHDDDSSALDTLEILRNNLDDVAVKEFDGYGHFTFEDMGTQEFPQLRDFILEAA